jgi:hypothetical protein
MAWCDYRAVLARVEKLCREPNDICLIEKKKRAAVLVPKAIRFRAQK